MESELEKAGEARPDFLRQDIERYQNAANHRRQTLEKRGRELRDIKVRLEAWGAEGLEEQLNEKEAELDQCIRRYQELHRRDQGLDLLREAGKPTLVILDDTLVQSDSERLEDMKRILFDAASRHQILLFTCDPEKWQDLGVPPLDIQASKEQGASMS